MRVGFPAAVIRPSFYRGTSGSAWPVPEGGVKKAFSPSSVC
ncbi:hypothetical protein HMPREF3038_03261 [Akkermansia sp. KLE1797]|nr:hypothetical protein HMPREF3038_03261 [Akkermansia sp. KLE1797]KXU55125.1 hypothetical protein HMPREF3039_00678 [Akkermansia sp. KLE1798]KZA06131.1 hypothetical protein HMPREF1326_00170 [Akkermansia sp. KLE1605]